MQGESALSLSGTKKRLNFDEPESPVHHGGGELKTSLLERLEAAISLAEERSAAVQEQAASLTSSAVAEHLSSLDEAARASVRKEVAATREVSHRGKTSRDVGVREPDHQHDASPQEVSQQEERHPATVLRLGVTRESRLPVRRISLKRRWPAESVVNGWQVESSRPRVTLKRPSAAGPTAASPEKLSAVATQEPVKRRKLPKKVQELLAMGKRDRNNYIKSLSERQQVALSIQLSMAEGPL
mmetsp:Transcript_61424/g.163446  ORF Transcript_61424/g.163446 Transcript_61424/m.163446 type:complete len:242 (-) Transcript_61424:329-1054(-)